MSKIRQFLANKSSVHVQFLKYGMAGALATAVHLSTFTLLNETLLPADVSQESATRGWNFLFANITAFLLANVVGYLANRAWVFQPGRHSPWREAMLFFLVSGIAFVAGTPLGSLIVSHFAINEYFVFVLVLVLSIMVNFVGRKFWVFLH
jgi:putative flippase GtrA